MKLNLPTKKQFMDMLEEALLYADAKRMNTTSFEVIDGVCSWNLLVLPEFMYNYDDDPRYFRERMYEWLTQDKEMSHEEACELIESERTDFYEMHITTYWEYQGDEWGDFHALDLRLTFGTLMARIIDDFGNFIHDVAEYVAGE